MTGRSVGGGMQAVGHGMRLQLAEDPRDPCCGWLVYLCRKVGDPEFLCQVSRGWAPFVQADEAIGVLERRNGRDYRGRPWSLEDADGMVVALGFKGYGGSVPELGK